MTKKLPRYFLMENTHVDWESIIATLPMLLYWKNAKGVYLGCNASYANYAGISVVHDIIGKTDSALRWEKSKCAKYKELDEAVIQSNTTMTFEERVMLPDKSIAVFLSKKMPLHDDSGNVVGLVGILVDISDIKKSQKSLKVAKEQAEAANRSKTEFLENMRHDIRTPLTGIIGFAELIQKEAITPKVKEYADNLAAATKALLDFQNEILEVVKITTGSDSVASASFDLKKCAEKVVDLLRPKAIVKNLQLHFKFDGQLPAFVIGDSKRLFRILLELMTNALKFTDAGEITLLLTASRQTKTHLILRCEISDTGIGIPEDKFDAVFVRFHRLSSASDGLYDGTGLGLTVVKQFIEALSGTISVTSKVGQGSTFTCEIPLLISFNNIEQISSQKEVPSFFGNPLVLLVEDHAMTAKVMQLLFSDLGCRVDIAVDAKNALQKIKAIKYDVVLMDLGLPDSNGFSLAQDIRAISTHNMPIVALTAHKELDAEARCLASGMNAIFQKPLLKATAIHLLNRYLPSTCEMKKNVIDLVLGATRINQSEAAAKSMLLLLQKNIDSDYDGIHSALSEKNWAKLHDANHKLLGGLAYCGAPRLEAACRTLQDTLQQPDTSQVIHQHATRVLAEINALKQMIL